MSGARFPSDMTLMVIAKAPIPGKVKTRLCPPCTPSEAAALAEAALADTLDAVSRTSAGRKVVILDGRPGRWLPKGFEVISQRDGGLDARLAEGFAAVGGPAFLVGMDTPQVTDSMLAAACEDLARPGVDAVLGHASDGGWWGIGLRRPVPRVFRGIPMSTPFTGRVQEARLDALGLRWSRLGILRDVDRFEDAQAVAGSFPTSRFAWTVHVVAASIRARQPILSRSPLLLSAVGLAT